VRADGRSAWTSDELSRIGEADELEIASLRPDGSLRRPRTIWAVRHGDDIYVRSVNGADSAWYRGVQQRHRGHIAAGGVEAEVDFVAAAHDLDDEIDEAYRAKYGYFPTGLNHIVRPEARSTTLKLVPRS
jgi:hypothetical protein